MKLFRLWWIRPLIILLALLSIATLQLSKSSNHVAKVLGKQKLTELNNSYIEHATEESFATFLLLSGLKAGLSVMQSSSTGISFIVDFDIQVGNLVSSAQEVVDYGWKASILGLTVLGAMEIFLHFTESITPLLFSALLSCLIIQYGIMLLRRQPTALLKKLTSALLFSTLLAYVGIPLSIYTASLTSKAITGNYGVNVRNQINENYGHLLIKDDKNSLKSQAEVGASSYVKNAKELHQNHRPLTEHIIQHLVVVLFDAIIFPLMFLLAAVLLLCHFSKHFAEEVYRMSPAHFEASLGQNLNKNLN